MEAGDYESIDRMANVAGDYRGRLRSDGRTLCKEQVWYVSDSDDDIKRVAKGESTKGFSDDSCRLRPSDLSGDTKERHAQSKTWVARQSPLVAQSKELDNGGRKYPPSGVFTDSGASLIVTGSRPVVKSRNNPSSTAYRDFSGSTLFPSECVDEESEWNSSTDTDEEIAVSSELHSGMSIQERMRALQVVDLCQIIRVTLKLKTSSYRSRLIESTVFAFNEVSSFEGLKCAIVTQFQQSLAHGMNDSKGATIENIKFCYCDGKGRRSTISSCKHRAEYEDHITLLQSRMPSITDSSLSECGFETNVAEVVVSIKNAANDAEKRNDEITLFGDGEIGRGSNLEKQAKDTHKHQTTIVPINIHKLRGLLNQNKAMNKELQELKNEQQNSRMRRVLTNVEVSSEDLECAYALVSLSRDTHEEDKSEDSWSGDSTISVLSSERMRDVEDKML